MSTIETQNKFIYRAIYRPFRCIRYRIERKDNDQEKKKLHPLQKKERKKPTTSWPFKI